MAAIKVVPLPIMRKICESIPVACSGARSSSACWLGLMFRPGMRFVLFSGVFLSFNALWRLNSVDNDFTP